MLYLIFTPSDIHLQCVSLYTRSDLLYDYYFIQVPFLLENFLLLNP